MRAQWNLDINALRNFFFGLNNNFLVFYCYFQFHLLILKNCCCVTLKKFTLKKHKKLPKKPGSKARLRILELWLHVIYMLFLVICFVSLNIYTELNWVHSNFLSVGFLICPLFRSYGKFVLYLKGRRTRDWRLENEHNYL